MPRNSKDFVYIPVPVRIGSQLHNHLKDEAVKAVGDKAGKRKQIPVGPYIADLLDDRDRAIYGEEECKNLWFSTSTQYLSSLIEATVQKVVSVLPGSSWQVSVQPTEVVKEATEEEMEQEAVAFVGGWGDEDEE